MRIQRFVGTALLAAGLMVVQAKASAQVVTTLAGSGARGSADGDGAQASFSDPSGLAVDASGNIYVADRGNHKIRKITPSGAVTTLAGSGSVGSQDGTGAAASFHFPSGVAVDASGNVYVTEQSFWFAGGHSDADVRRITPDGEVTTVAALEPLVMSEAGVAVDASGDLFVADMGDIVDGGRGKVLRITPDGLVTTVAGDGTTTAVSNPRGVAIDNFGDLYVADGDTGNIMKVGPSGMSTVLAANLNVPAGLAVDSSGNVYVAELGNHAIRKVGSDGRVTTVAGSGIAGRADGTGTAASFNGPAGVALDGAGNLYVADTGNNKIRKIALEEESLRGLEVPDLWVTPEDETGYLAVTSSGIALGILDASGNRTREQSYGPYDQWVPVAAAGSLDGLSRVLWRNSDGRWDVWLVGADGVLGSFVFPSEPGLTVEDIAGGQAGVTHVLARGAGDVTLWTVDAQGGRGGAVSLGSYPGWTAAAISDGADGPTRVLWTNPDGRFGLSLASSAGIVQTTRYREDGTAVDVAVGGDGLTRILRVSSDGHVGLWIVDGSGTLVAIGPTYAAPPGFAARRLSAGQDGSARVLFRSSAGSKIWLLSPDGVLQGSIDLAVPAPPTGIAGNWTGTFDSADFVDCDSGTPAQASFTQDGDNVVGTLNAPNDCGFMGARFIGTLLGNTLSGKVGGDRFINAVATGDLSGTNLEITIGNGWGLIPGGQMHLHR